jgi:aryl-alcohol dehydrogenase-like predicted oxidoreductase
VFDHFNRRDFLKTAALSSAALALGAGAVNAADVAGNAAKLSRRPYKPGVELSLIGFPGLLLTRVDQPNADRIVAKAYERGCNYFDVAPAYGTAQEKMGPALEPYRKNVFLACKTKARDAAGAKKDLDNSLKLLRTDHFDLYQLHVLKDPAKDVDDAFIKGGCIDTILEAKKAGVIRHVGFSAHTVEAALAAMNRFDFDSVMFPLNYASIYKGEFGDKILELAKQKNVSRISIKAMVKQEWPQGADKGKWKHLWYEPLEGKDAELAIRWALSQEITAAIPPGDETCLWAMMDAGQNFKPVTAVEEMQLQDLAQNVIPFFRKGKITG